MQTTHRIQQIPKSTLAPIAPANTIPLIQTLRMRPAIAFSKEPAQVLIYGTGTTAAQHVERRNIDGDHRQDGRHCRRESLSAGRGR
jgi:hypothetical protein